MFLVHTWYKVYCPVTTLSHCPQISARLSSVLVGVAAARAARPAATRAVYIMMGRAGGEVQAFAETMQARTQRGKDRIREGLMTKYIYWFLLDETSAYVKWATTWLAAVDDYGIDQAEN